MPDISIVIPCYNEAQRIRATLNSVGDYLAHTLLTAEILVVDDGSTDHTCRVVEAMTWHIPSLQLIRLPRNQGKGRAVQRGMLQAKGDWVLFMDADNATALSEITKLWSHTAHADVVIGSRYAKGSQVVVPQPLYRRVLSRAGNALIRWTLVPGIHDTQCGFKLFSQRAAQRIFTQQRIAGFGFDIEVLTIAKRILHYRVCEVGVTWYNVKESKVRPAQDSWRVLKDLWSIRRNIFTHQYHASP